MVITGPDRTHAIRCDLDAQGSRCDVQVTREWWQERDEYVTPWGTVRCAGYVDRERVSSVECLTHYAVRRTDGKWHHYRKASVSA